MRESRHSYWWKLLVWLNPTENSSFEKPGISGFFTLPKKGIGLVNENI